MEINKEWIPLIPAFANILRADKGTKGDSEGRKKLKARKQLAYIYFMEDFKSPIYGYEENERRAEALRYVDLAPADVELDYVAEGLREYQKIQMNAARSLRTLKAAQKGLDALDNYLENVDFDARDKQGKLVNSPKEYVNNLQNLNKAYDELGKFEKRVYEELKDANAIRGKATMGDREVQRKEAQTAWVEGSEADYEASLTGATAETTIEYNPGSPAFDDLATVIRNSKGAKPSSSTNEEEVE